MNDRKKKLNTILVLLGAFSIVATLLPLVKTPYWWVRIFDFPRVQVAVICLAVLLASWRFLQGSPAFKRIWLLLLAAAMAWHIRFIMVYTPLYPTESKTSVAADSARTFSLLVCNVLMFNREAGKLLAQIDTYDPDIVLLTEPDAWWQEQMGEAKKRYPFQVEYPLSNTYGMLLYSKVPLEDPQVNFWVEPDIPSIFSRVRLPAGPTFDLYCLHPRPPKPGTHSDERDAELLIAGKKVKASGRPAVVAGDLNDVAWSHTTALFQRISSLLDPRQGRGFYNTFNAKSWLMRYPLDHVFHSKHFTVQRFVRLGKIESDHFPIFIKLSFEPEAGTATEVPKADAEDREEAAEKIEEGKD
jgi:endonuclease/exonuclease/phosphatase (EEP) superfamily protein YafD